MVFYFLDVYNIILNNICAIQMQIMYIKSCTIAELRCCVDEHLVRGKTH